MAVLGLVGLVPLPVADAATTSASKCLATGGKNLLDDIAISMILEGYALDGEGKLRKDVNGNPIRIPDRQKAIQCAFDKSDPYYNSQYRREIRSTVREAVRRSVGYLPEHLAPTPHPERPTGYPAPGPPIQREKVVQRLSGVTSSGGIASPEVTPRSVDKLQGGKTSSTAAGSRRILTSWKNMAFRGRMMPAPSALLRMAPYGMMNAAAAVTAFSVGYSVGRTAYGFFEVDVDKVEAAGVDGYRIVPYAAGDRHPASRTTGYSEYYDDSGFRLEGYLGSNGHTNPNYVVDYFQMWPEETICANFPEPPPFPDGWSVWVPDPYKGDGQKCKLRPGGYYDEAVPGSFWDLYQSDDDVPVKRFRRGRATDRDDPTKIINVNVTPTEATSGEQDDGIGREIHRRGSPAPDYIAGAFPEEGDPAPEPDPTKLRVPLIEPGETYPTYAKRLEDLGLAPKRDELPTPDERYGPDAAISTTPAGGEEVAPGEVVHVRANPRNAPHPNPNPSGGGSGIVPDPPPPEIDLDRANLGQLCTTFPIGFPCWVIKGLAAWSVPGEPLEIDWPIVAFDHQVMHVHMSTEAVEPVLSVVRPLLILVMTLGTGWLFFSFARGGSKGGDD